MDGHTDEKVHLVLKGCKRMADPHAELGLEKRVTFNNHAHMRLSLYATRIGGMEIFICA